MAINERFIWAAGILATKPHDTILEIGCGTGILVHLLASRLEEGRIVAIDQSKKMILNAEKRNGEYIGSGKVKLENVELAKFSTNTRFNKIAAFNVNAFRQRPATEFSRVADLLTDDGLFYLFYQLPYEPDKETIDEWKAIAALNNFEINKVLSKKLEPASVYCLLLCPKYYRKAT